MATDVPARPTRPALDEADRAVAYMGCALLGLIAGLWRFAGVSGEGADIPVAVGALCVLVAVTRSARRGAWLARVLAGRDPAWTTEAIIDTHDDAPPWSSLDRVATARVVPRAGANYRRAPGGARARVALPRPSALRGALRWIAAPVAVGLAAVAGTAGVARALRPHSGGRSRPAPAASAAVRRAAAERRVLAIRPRACREGPPAATFATTIVGRNALAPGTLWACVRGDGSYALQQCGGARCDTASMYEGCLAPDVAEAWFAHVRARTRRASTGRVVLRLEGDTDLGLGRAWSGSVVTGAGCGPPPGPSERAVGWIATDSLRWAFDQTGTGHETPPRPCPREGPCFATLHLSHHREAGAAGSTGTAGVTLHANGAWSCTRGDTLPGSTRSRTRSGRLAPDDARALIAWLADEAMAAPEHPARDGVAARELQTLTFEATVSGRTLGRYGDGAIGALEAWRRVERVVLPPCYDAIAFPSGAW